MARTEITVTTVVDIDVPLGAKWFAGLDDEEQTQFFKEVAAAAESWPNYQGMQWYLVGRHLAKCECSSPGARDMIRNIYEAMVDKENDA